MDKREQDQMYDKAGFGCRMGFGKSPALVVIDMNYGGTDLSCPQAYDLDDVIGNVKRLLAVARSKAIPVVYTTNEYEKGCWDAGIRLKKHRHMDVFEVGSKYVEIDSRIAPQPGEPLIKKKYSSAFFGTHLASSLNAARVDTVILTGTSVSGCVRATAMDAINHGFRTIVVREAVGDRSPLALDQNLIDIDAKIGDVVSVEETLGYLNGLA